MTDKLTDADRERIEQEARTTSGWNNWVAFKRGAEYEHNYQREQQEKLQAFKTYVHKRLDDMGIPVDPESPHKLAGCRVGGRLDFIENERMESRDKVRKLEAERSELQAWKESEMELWGPVLDYAQNHGRELGIKPGEWISEKILQFLKDKVEFNSLKTK